MITIGGTKPLSASHQLPAITSTKKVTTALNLLLQQRVLPLYRENALNTNNAQCKHAHIINTTDPRNSAGALSDSSILSLAFSHTNTHSRTPCLSISHSPHHSRAPCNLSRARSLSPFSINRCAKVLICGEYLLFLLLLLLFRVRAAATRLEYRILYVLLALSA